MPTPAEGDEYKIWVTPRVHEEALLIASEANVRTSVVWHTAIAYYLDWFESEVMLDEPTCDQQKEHIRRVLLDDGWEEEIRQALKHHSLRTVVDRQLAAQALSLLEEHLELGGALPTMPLDGKVKRFKVLEREVARSKAICDVYGLRPGAVWHSAIWLYLETYALSKNA